MSSACSSASSFPARLPAPTSTSSASSVSQKLSMWALSYQLARRLMVGEVLLAEQRGAPLAGALDAAVTLVGVARGNAASLDGLLQGDLGQTGLRCSAPARPRIRRRLVTV